MNDQGGCLHGCGASPEPGIGHPQPDRASGLDEGACVLRSQVLAFARDVHVGVNHRLVDTRWLGANKLQRALHERFGSKPAQLPDRKSTRLNSSYRTISYAVFCLKKKKEQRSAYESAQA